MVKVIVVTIIFLILLYMGITMYDELKKASQEKACEADLEERKKIDDAKHRQEWLAGHYQYEFVWICRSCGREHKPYETSCYCGMTKENTINGDWLCHYCNWHNQGTGFFANATCANCGSFWVDSIEDNKAVDLLKKYYCKPLPKKGEGDVSSNGETKLIPAPGKYGSESIDKIKSEKTSDDADIETDEFINNLSVLEEKRQQEMEEDANIERSLTFI